MFGPLGDTQHNHKKKLNREHPHVGLAPFKAVRALCLLIMNSFLLSVHSYVSSSVSVKALNEVIL